MSGASSERSSVTLRALDGSPLADSRVRDTVVATGHAIAERNGVTLAAVRTAPDAITVEIGASRLAALGFAAELRRLTNAWHFKKFGPPALWGELPPAHHGDDDEPDPWSIAPDWRPDS